MFDVSQWLEGFEGFESVLKWKPNSCAPAPSVGMYGCWGLGKEHFPAGFFFFFFYAAV